MERPAGRPSDGARVLKKPSTIGDLAKKKHFLEIKKNDTKIRHFKGVLGSQNRKFLYDISVAIRNPIFHKNHKNVRFVMVFVSIKMSQFLAKNAFFLSKAPINAA